MSEEIIKGKDQKEVKEIVAKEEATVQAVEPKVVAEKVAEGVPLFSREDKVFDTDAPKAPKVSGFNLGKVMPIFISLIIAIAVSYIMIPRMALPRGIYEADIARIDTNVATLSTQIASIHVPDTSGFTAQIGNLDTKLSGDIVTIKANIIALGERIDNLPIGVNGDIAALSKNITEIREQIEGIVIPNYSGNITILQQQVSELDTDLEALETQLDSLTIPYYASVTSIKEIAPITILEIGTYGSGDYPVIVTLYGSGLMTGQANASSNCIIMKQDVYGATPKPMLVLIIEPNSEWSASDTITLTYNGIGIIDYASVSIGSKM